MTVAFTSCAPNYAGKARVLFESLRRHCPDLELHWLVTEERAPELVDELGSDVDRLWFVDDLEQGRDPTWVFGHDLVELSTALKPHLLRELHREGFGLVLYFDPDIVLFSPLDDLLQRAKRSSVVLTPHLLTPEDDPRGILDHEVCTLRNGVYNLGFLAVRNCEEGRAFASWWCRRCSLLCTRDPASPAFTDQKWLDLATVFFPGVNVERSPRFNVAAWNVGRRGLAGTFDTDFQVAGERLGFYHFTGFDSGAHRSVVDHYAPTVTVDMLVEWYGLRSRHLAPKKDGTWRLGHYSSGWEVLSGHRRLYSSRDDLKRAFPRPLEGSESGGFAGWLQAEGLFGQPAWSSSAVR